LLLRHGILPCSIRALDWARGNGNSIGGPHLPRGRRLRAHAARTASARPRSAAQISLRAYREDLSLKDAALKVGYRTGEQFDKRVRPEDMAIR
jgi:hypothetical protein